MTPDISSSNILSDPSVGLINLSTITFYDPNEMLKNYLSRDFEGLAILSSFQNNSQQILLDDMRTLLVKKVIDREVNIALRKINFEVGKQQLAKFV